MLVREFGFALPPELIAQEPPGVRGASRMLLLDRRSGGMTDHQFTELPELLAPGDLLVLNDSRVLPARLFATRRGLRTQAGARAPEGRVEVLLTEPLPGVEGNVWRALVRPAKKVLVGERLQFAAKAGDPPLLEAEVIAAGAFGERSLRFAPVPGFHAALERIGYLPLPPYIRRKRDDPNTAEDRQRYQTVYSRPFGTEGGMQGSRAQPTEQQLAGANREEMEPEAGDRGGAVAGSAAAPTAGLHFTPEVLARLEAHGVEVASVTLHVGLGTFQPVRVERTEEIRLHAEPYTLGAAAAEQLNRAWAEGRRIVAVGTTTTRTLEHLARRFELQHGALSASQPLRLEAHSGSTSLFLSPGPEGDDRFRLVRGLLTNFHLPESTLLMLVSAFAGRARVLATYEHAVQARYRFFSYGDCMLVV